MHLRYTIIEKNVEVGGTWYDNIYPGVGCDVRSHLYSISSAINPYWSQSYSEGPEILQYVKDLAKPIRSKIKFNTSVVSATWNENTSKWNLVLSTGQKLDFDIVIAATGLLQKPQYPTFAGKELFQGATFHTNKWDPNEEFKGKRVGIIGTGASAVQTVPRIAEMGVESLTVFQRTATWCPPRANYKYSEFLKNIFKFVPLINVLYRWFLFWSYEISFFILFMLPSKNNPIIGGIHSVIQSLVHEKFRRHIKSTVIDQRTASKLIPKIPMGCKRITPSDNYLQAFNKDNVFLVTEAITGFNEKGIVTCDQTCHNLEVIIYATGFDLIGSVNSFHLRGLGGASVGDYHADAPTAYYGITHHLCPNFFTIGGQGSALGHNSVLFIGECQINYIRLVLQEMLLKKTKTLVLKEEALIEYQKMVEYKMRNKVFEGDKYCTSWYRNGKGVNWTFWPSNVISFWWRTLAFDSQNYFIS